MVIDPVCGMQLDEKQSAGSIVHDNRTYNFCSPDCLNKFRMNPVKYAGKSTAHTAAHPNHTGGTMQKAEATSERKELAKDPICGMMVNKAIALHTERGGRTYYFCSTGCQRTLSRPSRNSRR